MEYIGVRTIYDLSVNNKHSYITRSNFINSNTTSGRLSSQEPNLQQIPKTSVDPNIKKQLVAPDGKLYMALDYSQAELRIMAHLSGDETYLEALQKVRILTLLLQQRSMGYHMRKHIKLTVMNNTQIIIFGRTEESRQNRFASVLSMVFRRNCLQLNCQIQKLVLL